MVRYKFKKVKASKNTKKSKAAGMKNGKTVKGILPAGESKKCIYTKKESQSQLLLERRSLHIWGKTGNMHLKPDSR